MPSKANEKLVAALLERHGKTYSDDVGIKLGSNTPSPLFRWLCASILFSARIGADQAVKAARALSKAGLTTPKKMVEAGWERRVRILNENGYARYDESTSRMLGDTAQTLIDTYGGDLRKLRERAGNDPTEIRKALKRFKGLGDVGVDIFFRDIQLVWTEIHPFADKKSLEAAEKLNLGKDAKALSGYVSNKDFPRLLTALVRTALEKDFEDVRKAAA